jgi:hypothetical protein
MTTWVATIIKSRIENCKDSQEFSRQLVEAALRKYAQQTGQHYELHFICGLHMFIRSGAFWHINFLARPKDASGELPICFFAEATVFTGEDDEFLEEDIVLCCPIKPSTIGMYMLSLSPSIILWHFDFFRLSCATGCVSFSIRKKGFK